MNTKACKQGADKKECQAGFTFVELIAVLVILGILAVAALPKFSGVQEKAREKALHSAVSELNSQAALAFTSNRLKSGVFGEYEGYTGLLGDDFEISGQAPDTPAEGTIKLADRAGTYTLNWQAGTAHSPGVFSLGEKNL